MFFAYACINDDLFDLNLSDIYIYETRGIILLTGNWNARVRNGDRRGNNVCDRPVSCIDFDYYNPDIPSTCISADHICYNFVHNYLIYVNLAPLESPMTIILVTILIPA